MAAASPRATVTPGVIEQRFNGRRLARIRVLSGFSREALARKAAVSIETIARAERGEVSEPRAGTLGAISAAHGVPVKEFYDG